MGSKLDTGASARRKTGAISPAFREGTERMQAASAASADFETRIFTNRMLAEIEFHRNVRFCHPVSLDDSQQRREIGILTDDFFRSEAHDFVRKDEPFVCLPLVEVGREVLLAP